MALMPVNVILKQESIAVGCVLPTFLVLVGGICPTPLPPRQTSWMQTPLQRQTPQRLVM